ncbi:MAG: Hsp20/alpha crystallin family protein [Bdellovibrionales bacterium]|nr:Hsp20/alpha crystallin family protein [Bdellovibrionales bacterium]
MKLNLYQKTPMEFFSDFEKDFENFWIFPKNKKNSFPVCDFNEDKDYYFISLDLPGLNKEDLKINYENQILTISGERKEEYKKEIKENSSHVREKFYGSFSRSFHLASQLDSDKIEAQFSKGVLELVCPKNKKDRGREIEVKEAKTENSLFSKLAKKVS